MKTLTMIGCALAAAIASAVAAAAQDTTQSAVRQETIMGAPIVFFDIAGPETAGLSAFYSTVFGWGVGAGGAVTVETHAPLQGTLRTEATNENLLYFGVRDVTATLEQIAANGGTIAAPRFEVPGVVILGLFHDPAGNRMGLVEIDENGVAIAP